MEMMGVVAIAGALFGAMGSGQSMTAARENALRRQQAARYDAAQLEQNAGQEVAASQRGSLEAQHQARLVQSRALAVAGASGGGISDPSIVNLLGKIEGEGAYRAALKLYEGEDRARAMRQGAVTRRYEGDIALLEGEAQADAYAAQGISKLFSGATSMLSPGGMFAKYGQGGPSGDSALIGGFDSDTYNLNTYG